MDIEGDWQIGVGHRFFVENHSRNQCGKRPLWGDLDDLAGQLAKDQQHPLWMVQGLYVSWQQMRCLGRVPC